MQILFGNGEDIPARCKVYIFPKNPNKWIIICEPHLKARRVKITAVGRDQYLTLCEVSVFATGK